MQNSRVFLTGEGIQVVGARLNLNRVGFGATLHNFVYVKPRTEKKRADDTGMKEEGKKEIITSLQGIRIQRCRIGINWLTSFLDEEKSCYDRPLGGYKNREITSSPFIRLPRLSFYFIVLICILLDF